MPRFLLKMTLGIYGTLYSKLNGQSWKGHQVPNNYIKPSASLIAHAPQLNNVK